MDNDPNHPTTATLDKEVEYSSMAKSVAWSQPNGVEDKTDSRKANKPAVTEGGCSEVLAKHLQGGNSEFEMSVGSVNNWL